MNGIPVEIHVLQLMSLLVKEIVDASTVALEEDAVGRRVDRCATLPNDASGTVALIAHEQSSE